MDVGRALYNCDDEFEGRGYKSWCSFTKRSGRSEEECEFHWDTFEMENPITLKTLAWYARIDSPVLYEQWHTKRCEPFLEQATSGTDDDIAQALYEIYWLDFTCSDAKHKIWHIYKNHRWIPCDDGIELSRIISTEFRKIFLKFKADIATEADRSHDDHIIDKSNKLKPKITKLIKELKSSIVKKRIMFTARELFKDDNFNLYMNNNPDYFGTPNGVIETCSDRAIFRVGKPQDYITMCSLARYHPEYTWKHPLVKLVMKWMKQCFIDPDLREYILS